MVVDCMVVVGALTCCALLHCVCDSKAAQVNMRHQIQEFMLFEFDLSYNVSSEATKTFMVRKMKAKLITEQ